MHTPLFRCSLAAPTSGDRAHTICQRHPGPNAFHASLSVHHAKHRPPEASCTQPACLLPPGELSYVFCRISLAEHRHFLLPPSYHMAQVPTLPQSCHLGHWPACCTITGIIPHGHLRSVLGGFSKYSAPLAHRLQLSQAYASVNAAQHPLNNFLASVSCW